MTDSMKGKITFNLLVPFIHQQLTFDYDKEKQLNCTN